MNINEDQMKIYDAKNLPRISKTLRLFFFINKIPVLRRISVYYIRKKLLNKDTLFEPGFFVTSNNLQLGSNVSLSDTLILSYGPVIIGDNVSFSYRNIIITSTHDYNDFNKVITKPVIIGNNVWITTNVTILPGVNIGENSIIGAGSVVTKDIPSNVYAAGNPCKIIKSLR